MRARTRGIVLINNKPHLLRITARMFEEGKGSGEVYVQGRVASSFTASLARAIGAVNNYLLRKGCFTLSETSNFALDIGINNRPEVPLAGNSYELPLALALYGCYRRRSFPTNFLSTGSFSESGEVEKVGGILEKRHFAATSGYSRILLPAGQIDPYNRHIDQVPVASLSDALKKLDVK